MNDDALLSRSSLSVGPFDGGDPGSAHAGPHDPRTRWELRGELGWGGMGRVVLAFDHWLGREVALKQPLGHTDLARFEREALITARLEHPGIVPVFDVGTSPDGRPWFAMRVVRGRALSAILAEPGPSDSRALLMRALLTACEAVAFAHDRGVVHRDLKPANLMLGAFGESQVIDWGLAHAPGFSDTEHGKYGTLPYMSPEQVRGEPAGPPSDVFSLGAILFEIIAGRRAFPGPRPDEVRAALTAGRVPSLREAAPEAPPELAAIVARAMAPVVADRYPDAKALAEDLARYLDGRRVSAHTYSTFALLRRVVHAWRAPLIVAGLGLFALALVSVLAVLRIAEERDHTHYQLALALALAAESTARTGARADAEILAAASLEHAQLPSARGVLSALAGPRPRREALGPVPCDPLDAFGDRALCRLDGAVALVEAGAVRWRAPFDPDRGAVFLDEGRVVMVSSPAHALNAETGAMLRSTITPLCGGRLRRSAGGGLALDVSAQCVGVIGLDGVRQIPDAVCEGRGFDTFALADDDHRWVAACNGGPLVFGDLSDPTRIDLRVGFALREGVATALAIAPDGGSVIVGSSTGAVIAFDPITADEVLLDNRPGLVTNLALDAAHDHLLVVRDVGPAELMTLSDRATLGRLPERRDAIFALDDEGRVLEVGATFERWDFSAVRPSRLTVDSGISTLAVSRDGRHLAVASGPEVVLIDTSTRRIARRARWQRGLVKDLAFDPSGVNVIAHGLSELTLRGFTTAELTPSSSIAVAPLRRLVVLADGSVLGASYRRGTSIYHPDRPPALVSEEVPRDLVGSPDGHDVAFLSESGAVTRGRDLHLGRPLERCGTAPEARALALDPTRDVIWGAGLGEVRPVCGADPTSYRAEGAELISLAVTAEWLAAGSVDGRVFIWRRDGGAPYATYRSHLGRASGLVIDPRGAWLASGGWDAAVVFMTLPPPPSGDLAAIEAAWGIDLRSAYGAIAPPGKPNE